MQALHCVRALPWPRTTIKYYIKATCVSTYPCSLSFSSKRDRWRFSANRKTTKLFRLTFRKRKCLLVGGSVVEISRIRENLERKKRPQRCK